MTTRWSTSDLERFHDGDLDAAAARELSEALLSDRELRRRFAAVRRADDLARAALLAPAEPSRSLRPLALAAGLGLAAVVLALVLAPNRPAPRTQPAELAAERHPEPERGLLLLATLPYTERAPRTTPDHAPKTDSAPRPTPPPARQAADFELALAQGNVAAAAALIHDADEEVRAEAIRRVAALLRSANTALRLLDSLPEDLQVQACREMAGELALRPVALRRLRELAARPEHAAPAREAFRQLSKDPSIRVWLNAGYAPS